MDFYSISYNLIIHPKEDNVVNLKKSLKSGTVEHACDPWETEAGDHKFKVSLSNLSRPCLEILQRAVVHWLSALGFNLQYPHQTNLLNMNEIQQHFLAYLPIMVCLLCHY